MAGSQERWELALRREGGWKAGGLRKCPFPWDSHAASSQLRVEEGSSSGDDAVKRKQAGTDFPREKRAPFSHGFGRMHLTATTRPPASGQRVPRRTLIRCGPLPLVSKQMFVCLFHFPCFLPHNSPIGRLLLFWPSFSCLVWSDDWSVHMG